MSERASELLRRLNAETGNGVALLLIALPEIIAVVEAAEFVSKISPEMQSKLDALVSKLSGEAG